MSNTSELLCRSWRHAYEESHPDFITYYSQDYPLPASRGRPGMSFQSNGEFIKETIAPSCGFNYTHGSWHWQPNGNVLIDLPSERCSYELEIVSLTETQLRVKWQKFSRNDQATQLS
ncbi:hypothetical protein [Nodularia sp. UHCC 0506]|uniref:hypothetical protein n=1 Tax=Nodularia sp. UHCC 0506 TaxID=3110243 RepID=UPI002B1F9662|nr:hypothetical protein [Nodularia sp. UHCC 0506]MEA5515175.1 hypothetical protein [Nodularia sp. UHCC 0506]